MKTTRFLSFSFIFNALLYATFISTHYADHCHTSQTFMFTRPVYQNVAATSYALHNIPTHGASIQALSLYQKSQKYEPVAAYFLLNNKQKIRVAGDNHPSASKRDVRAEWLELPDDFHSIVSINPEQEQIGGYIQYNHALEPLFKYSFFSHWWLHAAIPILTVRNKLKIEEKNIQNPGEQPRTVREALTRTQLNFARMDAIERSENGIPEIRLGVGRTFVDDGEFLLLVYSTLGIPTTSDFSARTIFYPAFGSNGHADFTTGIAAALPLQPCSASYLLQLFFTIENHYYLERTQSRTFDLKNKQWSRYLLLRKEGQKHPIPAVNVLTRRVNVEPFNVADLSSGLKFQKECLAFEAAYNLWVHDDERIKLCHSSTSKSTLDAFGIAGTGVRSASTSSIDQRIDDPDGQFITLSLNDIDLTSAASQGGHTHKAHAAFYYTQAFNHATTLTLGLGGYCEKPNTNNALENAGFLIHASSTF